METFTYPTEVYPFREAIQNMLEVADLELLPAANERLTRERDQSTIWHWRYYHHFEKMLAPLYYDFVREVILPRFGEAIVYQRVPTFRVSLPGNVAVGEWHRDRDYGHRRPEANFWLPVTRAEGSSTVWIEQTDRPQPLNVQYGEVLTFDAVNLLHGNVVNITGRSRVSFDFRAYPARLYRERDTSTVNGKMKFKVGSYWTRLQKEGSK